MNHRRWLALTASFLGASVAVACAAPTEEPGPESDESAVSTGFDPQANLDAELGEKLWPNEKRDIKATADIIKGFLERRFREGRTDRHGKVRFMRDAHAKSHGCVKGTFEVRSDVPDDLKVGVFARPDTFKTWVRYSNGNSEVRYDWKRDARGMAIKLIGVDGRKLVSEFPEQGTQDFVMINFPVFFVDNPVHYAETLKVFHSGFGFETLGQVLSVSQMPIENAKLALGVNGSHIESPIKEPYWSMAPIRNGRGKAVKYAALPVKCGESRAFPTELSAQQAWVERVESANKKLLPSTTRDELREAMKQQLEDDREDACYLFVVQRFLDQDRTPIEHTTVDWDKVSPFVPVADLRIPAQRFASEAQDTFCDDMTFTPWHALPEHKPLGVVNRTRFTVYSLTSKMRRENNRPAISSSVSGPTGEESF